MSSASRGYPRRGGSTASVRGRGHGHDNHNSEPHNSNRSGHGRGSSSSVPHDSSPSVYRRGSDASVPQGHRHTQLTPSSPGDATHLGNGYDGSNSDAGGHGGGIPQDRNDPFLDGDEHDSVVNDTPPLLGDRPFITTIGKKFGKCEIHRRIRRIFDSFFDEPWPTYKSLPKDVLCTMFDCFKTYYQWIPTNEGMIKGAFEKVLADRWPDVMKHYREVAARRAMEAGHQNVSDRDFVIIRNYRPDNINDHIWQALCDHWNTPQWLKKSDVGKANRRSADDTGKVSRHTGGSMGYEEHRINLKLRRPATYSQIFCDTHLTKEDKKKFWDGEYDNIQDLNFCTSKAKETLVAYERGMIERYGEDMTQHPGDDADVWMRAQEGRGRGSRIYGIGNSDLDFLVTGSSSSQGSFTTFAAYERSQERVRELEERQSQMQTQIQTQAEQLQTQAEQLQTQAKRHTQLEGQIAEIMRQLCNNNPPNS